MLLSEIWLNKLKKTKPKKNYSITYAIAASIVLMLGISVFFNVSHKPKELKFASQETKRTDSIFGALIANELEKLHDKKSPENEQIINDALKQMKAMDGDYAKIIAPIIEAIRELKEENDTLRHKVDALQKKLGNQQ